MCFHWRYHFWSHIHPRFWLRRRSSIQNEDTCQSASTPSWTASAAAPPPTWSSTCRLSKKELVARYSRLLRGSLLVINSCIHYRCLCLFYYFFSRKPHSRCPSSENLRQVYDGARFLFLLSFFHFLEETVLWGRRRQRGANSRDQSGFCNAGHAHSFIAGEPLLLSWWRLLPAACCHRERGIFCLVWSPDNCWTGSAALWVCIIFLFVRNAERFALIFFVLEYGLANVEAGKNVVLDYHCLIGLNTKMHSLMYQLITVFFVVFFLSTGYIFVLNVFF